MADNRLRDCGVTAAEAAVAFKLLGDAMREAMPLNLQEIAMERMDAMYDDFGLFCFLLPEWWRWAWMLLTSKPEDHTHG